MKTVSGDMANMNYYNKLIENKKAELAELIDIRDKLTQTFEQQKLVKND